MKIPATGRGSARTPRPVAQDSRGILDPGLLQQRVALTRYPPPPPLEDVIDRFWVVCWDLPAGFRHRQQVLTHPAANLSVGPADGVGGDGPIEARLYGVSRRLSSRTLVGRGWTVAAMTTVGGLGALVDGSAARYTDRVQPLGATIGIDEAALIDRISAPADEAQQASVLADALTRRVRQERIELARQVAAAARIAETDRQVQTLGDLSERTGVAPRSLQRHFRELAGVSPTWVIRRYRLLDAAEAVRLGQPVSGGYWASLAAALGYADQAHLIREFRAAIGQTPGAYARAQRALLAGVTDQ